MKPIYRQNQLYSLVVASTWLSLGHSTSCYNFTLMLLPHYNRRMEPILKTSHTVTVFIQYGLGSHAEKGSSNKRSTHVR
jgi:hypothetical protein